MHDIIYKFQELVLYTQCTCSHSTSPIITLCKQCAWCMLIKAGRLEGMLQFAAKEWNSLTLNFLSRMRPSVDLPIYVVAMSTKILNCCKVWFFFSLIAPQRISNFILNPYAVGWEPCQSSLQWKDQFLSSCRHEKKKKKDWHSSHRSWVIACWVESFPKPMQGNC